MRQIALYSIVLLVLSALSCSGGSSDDNLKSDKTLNSGLSASFVPDQPAPGGNSTAMAAGDSSGDLSTIEVNVTEVSDFFSATLDVTFDPDRAEFLSFAWSDLLECNGQSSICLLELSEPGRIVIGASRTGSAGSFEVTGSRTLVDLVFRVTVSGDSPLEFANMSLSDSQQPIPGIEWFGGDLVGN